MGRVFPFPAFQNIEIGRTFLHNLHLLKPSGKSSRFGRANENGMCKNSANSKKTSLLPLAAKLESLSLRILRRSETGMSMQSRANPALSQPGFGSVARPNRSARRGTGHRLQTDACRSNGRVFGKNTRPCGRGANHPAQTVRRQAEDPLQRPDRA